MDREFLVNCSIYKVLNPERCNRLFDSDNAEEILTRLGEKLLLLSPLSGARCTYNCHQLFRDFLLERLGNRKSEMQRRAAHLAEISDETTQAILSTLAKDNSELVNCPVMAYLKQSAIHPEADVPEIDSQDIRAPLTIKTLGTFQVFSGDRELAGWRTKKTRELLALLLHLETSASKDRLMEELWPENDSQSGNSLFRTTMHYLRKQLEHEGLGGLVLYQHDIYSLRKDYYMLDWKTFERLITTGMQEEPLKEVGAGMLSRAVHYYRGDYLAEAVDYSWAVPRQVRLKHLYTEALLNLARYYRSRGKHTRARAFLLLLIEADPLCETAHRLLMQVYDSLGERQALLDEKNRFGLMLREEIGLPPDSATKKLYLRLGCSG